jgi:trans-aconitate methyltransferase
MCVNVRWRISGPAEVWNGESMTLACSAAPNGFSADVGCGHGASTILLAKAFPKSEFVGFDYHGPSIETATQRAKDAGAANARSRLPTPPIMGERTSI